MKYFNILAVALLLFYSLLSKGQNLNTSHLVWNQPIYNIGALTSSDFSRITLDYRKSYLTEKVSFTSASAWMDYPILYRNKNMGAFFLMIENEQSGGKIDFKTININAALARRILLSRLSYLTFGLGAGYRQFGLSLDGFTTSSQFVDGTGFDPSLPNGESSGFYRTSYITVNSGLSYRKVNFRQDRLLQIGLSAGNLNRQLKTWGDQGSNLPVQWSTQFQYLILTKGNIAAGPDLAVFRHGGNYNGYGGLSLRYYLNSAGNIILSDQSLTFLNFFARVAAQQKGILGMQYSNGKFILGASYDFPFGNLSNVSSDAFEILFALTPQVHNPERNKRSGTSNRNSGRRKNQAQRKTILAGKVSIPEPQSGDSLQIQKMDTASSSDKNIEGKITPGNIESENPQAVPEISPLYFITGSSKLDVSGREFLEKVYSAYLKNGEYRIILTGHTDDVGDRKDNLKLSLNRAGGAAAYLVKLGVDEENIEVRGKGEDAPLVPNNSVEGRAGNRRVEISLIKK